jgi:predicted amidohydrolase
MADIMVDVLKGRRLSWTGSRRDFLIGGAGFAFAQIATSSFGLTQKSASNSPKLQRITLAQVIASRDVRKNLIKARAVFDQARKDGAGWVLFPEGFLSGYYAGFRQEEVAAAFAEVQALCAKCRVIGLIGTGWKEGDKKYDQIRIVDATGNLVGQYAKTSLCYSESEFTAGGFPMVHVLDGIKFGTLICNDLWVTPGFSDGPDPHLTLKVARAGAQVIFHAVNSGTNLNLRSYQESNLLIRAWEAKCPIVTVNAFTPPISNVTSGVVGTNFNYQAMLPRVREVIKTVSFSPVCRDV